LAILAVLAAAVLAYPATAGAHPTAPHGTRIHRVSHSTSTNWAGYSATGARFTSVSASWKQPAVTCTSATAYSSFWVGLDGDGSNSVEQTGTEADCVGGKAQYSAWYEMYPKFPVTLSMAVHAGDSFTASVTTDGRGSFTLSIRNVTTGASFSTVQRLKRAQLASAEVIAEAPSGSGGVLPLANFGTVTYSASAANGSSLGGQAPTQIIMINSAGTPKDSTSAINASGGFSNTWLRAN